MEKILITVKGCSIHYNGKKYVVGDELEIPKEHFRNDCMEKAIEKSLPVAEEKEELDDEKTLPMKELKEMAIALGIEIKTKSKNTFMKELKDKFIENNLNLDEEIEKFINKKNEDI